MGSRQQRMTWRACVMGTREVALHTPRGHPSHRLRGLETTVCSYQASGEGLPMAHSHGIQLPARALCGGAPAHRSVWNASPRPPASINTTVFQDISRALPGGSLSCCPFSQEIESLLSLGTPSTRLTHTSLSASP